jgi:hypothetical protein
MRKIVKQHISKVKVVIPFRSSRPLWTTNVATVMSIAMSNAAGRLKNPMTSKIPPMNSVTLHKYAPTAGNGMLKDSSVPAKSDMEAGLKRLSPYRMKIMPHQIRRSETESHQTAAWPKRNLFIVGSRHFPK